MSPFNTTTMAIRAGSELFEAGSYGWVYVTRGGEGDLRLPASLLVAASTIIAVTDTFLVTMRLLGRASSPRVELALLPVRLIFWIVKACVEDPIIINTTHSQSAVVLQKGVEVLGNKTNRPELAAWGSAILAVVEIGIRVINVKNLYDWYKEPSSDLVF